MSKPIQQWAHIAENYTTAINNFTKLANVSLENAQKIATLQYEAASNFIEHSANTTKNLLDAKTPTQASDVIKDFAAFSVEATLEKSKEIFSLLGKSQESFKDIATASFKYAGDSILSSIEKVGEVNPSWSKAATAYTQKLIDATTKANETLGKVAEQVSTIANRNVESAATATLNTLKKANTTAQGFTATK